MPQRIKKYKPAYVGSQGIKNTGAWKNFSLFVRRSSPFCYSCGVKVHWKEANAGHYIAGNICGKALFISEINVKKQCRRCNLWLHGNAPAFALALRKEYGDDILERLEQIRREEKEKGIICRFSKEELKEIELKYLSKLNTL